MREVTRKFRSTVLLAILVSTLFAGSVFAASDITATGERYTDVKGNDLKTVSVEFRNIPSDYEGWQASTNETTPVCGVVTNGIVSCEFRNTGPVSGAWLILYKKGTNQVVSFYVSFQISGMKQKEEIKPPAEDNECKPNSEVPLFTESRPQ